MYLMCSPGQFFFFQYATEMPKGWTPLLHNPHRIHRTNSPQFVYEIWTCMEYKRVKNSGFQGRVCMREGIIWGKDSDFLLLS